MGEDKVPSQQKIIGPPTSPQIPDPHALIPNYLPPMVRGEDRDWGGVGGKYLNKLDTFLFFILLCILIETLQNVDALPASEQHKSNFLHFY